jgi:hypothetical protein
LPESPERDRSRDDSVLGQSSRPEPNKGNVGFSAAADNKGKGQLNGTRTEARKSGRLAGKQAEVSGVKWKRRPESEKSAERVSKSRAEAKPQPRQSDSKKLKEREDAQNESSKQLKGKISLPNSKRKTVDAENESDRRSKTPKTDISVQSPSQTGHSVSEGKAEPLPHKPSHPKVVVQVRRRPSTTHDASDKHVQSSKATASSEPVLDANRKPLPVRSMEKRTSARPNDQSKPLSARTKPVSKRAHQNHSKSKPADTTSRRRKLRPRDEGGVSTTRATEEVISDLDGPKPLSQPKSAIPIQEDEIIPTLEPSDSEVAHGGDIEEGSAVSVNGSETGEQAVDESEEEEEDSQGELLELDKQNPLETIYRFIDSCDHDGSCESQLGNRIRDMCLTGSETVADPETRWPDIEEMCSDLAICLSTVRLLKSRKEKATFHEDASTYVFHSLARFLEAVYNWAQQSYGDPLASVPALDVVVPLMQKYLWFADSIRKWAGKAAQLADYERNIKNVDRGFLIPLRKAEAQHRSALEHLKRMDAARQRREEAKAEEEAEARRAAAVKRLKERIKLWSHLHACRLECETRFDIRRRRHLACHPLEDMEERDANGVRFERENIFRERVTPFIHRPTSSQGREWTSPQNLALLDGLEKYAGMSMSTILGKQFVKKCFRSFSI